MAEDREKQFVGQTADVLKMTSVVQMYGDVGANAPLHFLRLPRNHRIIHPSVVLNAELPRRDAMLRPALRLKPDQVSRRAVAGDLARERHRLLFDSAQFTGRLRRERLDGHLYRFWIYGHLGLQRKGSNRALNILNLGVVLLSQQILAQRMPLPFERPYLVDRLIATIAEIAPVDADGYKEDPKDSIGSHIATARIQNNMACR